MNFRRCCRAGWSLELAGALAFAVMLLPVTLSAQLLVPADDLSLVMDGGDSWGCAWTDYDLNGAPDLFVANRGSADEAQSNFLYRNNGDGSFTRVSDADVVDAASLSRAGFWADYDNDGRPDLLVVNQDYRHNALYRNMEGATLVKQTTGPVVNDEIDESVFAGNTYDGDFGDYDNDGWLDIFVVNRDNERNFLFRNLGNGAFDRILSGNVASDRNESRSGNFIDIDGDGDLDLYVFNDRQNNILYRNRGGGEFEQRPGGALPQIEGRVRGATWGDYDNDGLLDCFVIYSNEPNALYINRGGGRYRWRDDALPSLDGSGCVSAAWADYDNDGFLDLAVTSLDDHNFLYRNNGDGSFSRVVDEAFVTDREGSTGLAWADFDGDGFLDLFVSKRGGSNNCFYRNQGNENHWIVLAPQGSVSNRQAIGARVRVIATIGGQRREQIRVIMARSGPIAQSCPEACFGLGDAAAVDTVIVEWPAGGRDTLINPARDMRHVVVETPRETGVAAAAPDVDMIELHISPNPLRQDAKLSWTQRASGFVRLQLFALDGRLLRNDNFGFYPAGTHSISLDGIVATADLHVGAYLARVTAGAASGEQKFIIIR